MRKEYADLVYPVLTYALRVKEQLARGEALSLQKEQSALKGLLKSEAEARRWGEFSGDNTAMLSADGRRTAEGFLGIRYALVCWLDEIFILDSPWRTEWTENSLEVALYGTRDRAEKFWEQARRAEARPSSDALEVFFLCVMLGFRGETRNNPERLRAWREAAEAQIAQNQHQREWAGPPDAQPTIDVPPLPGAGRFRTMALTLGAAVLVLIPAATYFLVLGLNKQP
jgi:type VI secretion system protein ImpK